MAVTEHVDCITICLIKRKENFFSLFFFRVLKRAVLARVRRVEGGGTSAKTALFSTREKNPVLKSFFFLSNMQFCFMKRLFYNAFDQSMSVAQSESSAAVVAGRVLNFGTKEGTTLFEPIERPITCVSALYDARQAS